MRILLAMLALAGLCLGGVAATASGGDKPARARATAQVAGGAAGPQITAAARQGATERRGGNVEAGVVSVRQGEALARTRIGSRPEGHAVAVGRSVDALDGLVTAYGVRREVTVTPGRTVYEGRVLGLRIDGEMVGDVTTARRFDLPDGGGYVEVNTGAAGIRVVLSEPRAGRPAGTEVLVAVVTAAAAAAPKPAATAAPTATPTPRAEPRRRERRPRDTRAPKPVPAPGHLTGGGYAFPVYGDDVTIADDFGGPRQIGPHQGNDIFASFGSPVLAVTDGTLQKVGTLPISGNRLWLVTDRGDAFFYAHLSSFSELAETGRRVRAGDVLGFVGNTGDAEPTPPHVHFEIRPRGIDGPASDPHEVLLAWQRRADVEPSGWLRRVGADTAERPGALVEVRDFIAGE